MNSKDTLINKRSLLETNIAWMLILFLIIQGTLTLILIFPFISLEMKNSHIQRWSKRLLRILSIQLDIVGETSLPNVPYLLVSNHISWVDIHAINAFKPIRFVAKSEVASWPIFGWMAKQLNTIFIHRNSYRHAGKVVSQLVEVLQSEAICIFPEGTSTNGEVELLSI